MTDQQYIGSELDVFAHATNWKAYLRALVAPYLRGHVLEVGAGLGATTIAFRDDRQTSWTALEPDSRLADRARARVTGGAYPVDIRVGTLETMASGRRYDCVLYVDVLEHIEADRDELRRAAALLNPSGAIVVLSPAHQWLYTAFDRAIGHYRRYDVRSLGALTPPGTALVRMRYVDCAGMVLSALNRAVLRSASPSVSQIKLWDRCFVPISRGVDRWLGWRVGKSILAVWRVDS